MRTIERSIGIGVVVVAAALGAGCGGSEVPVKQLADTEASIRAARELGAEDTPKAALQLKIAQDGLQRAQKLNEDGEGEQARAVLEEAHVDAELAVLLAKQEKMEASASQAKRRAESSSGHGQAKSYDQAKSVDTPKADQ